MQTEQQKYYLPRYLDEPLRFILFTWDEALLLVLPIVITYAVFNALLIGIFIGLFSFVALKKLKGDRGQYYLLALCYWYLPALVSLRLTPPSYQREWIG